MAIITFIIGLVVGAIGGGFWMVVAIADAMDNHEED